MRGLVFASAIVVGSIVGCGGGDPSTAPIKTPAAPGGSKDPSKWPADDRSMCDWRNKPELEVSEVAGPGALKPNVRRVYKVIGDESRSKTLICREIDSNLDGIKDTVRTFNNKGEAIHEEADRDYDGRVDVWIKFVGGRIAEEDVDTNKDGKPDVWKYYVNGQLQRIRRDRDHNGKPDVWEIYTKGRLERMGLDETNDGHVDRWDRDEQLKRDQEAAEKSTLAQMAAAADAGSVTAPPLEEKPSTLTVDAGAPPKPTGDAGAPKKK